MNILMIYPETPTTFYSFRNALKFISKKSAEPPLGLLTVAALLPKTWQVKLIDMNVESLKDKHFREVDFVFISGMDIQIKSFQNVVKKCNQKGIKVVAGGPMVTMDHSKFLGVDHFVLNEAEITLPHFLNDLKTDSLRKVYSTSDFPDISQTPIPRWDLLDMSKYANLSMQYSRGCPFNCEFCSITFLNGRLPRTKSKDQFLNELDSLYQWGWRGGVFIVDDNFIGNKSKLKSEVLPAVINWSEQYEFPFKFSTEASINLADDQELIDLMVKAGFHSTFIGIETPNDASLKECGKTHNRKRNLLDSVKILQKSGLMVSAGFIVGFDNDTPNIFKQQINFIQKSGIVTAMVGLLNAPIGTKLFKRLKGENRLRQSISGDNMDGSINFEPSMKYQKLIEGYKKVLETIYSQKHYYERIKVFLKEYYLPKNSSKKVNFRDVKAFLKSIWKLGFLEKGRKYYWKLLFSTLRDYPQKFSLAMTLSIYGYHFRKVVQSI